MVKKEHSTLETFKLWIFPSLVSILAMMIWNNVNEIKIDVKALIAQSSVDKTRIDNLERVVFNGKVENTSLPINNKLPESPYNIIAIIPSREELIPIKIKKKNI